MNPMLLTLAGLSVGLFLSGCKTTGSGDETLINPLKSTTEVIANKAKSTKEKTILLTEDAAKTAKGATIKAGDAAMDTASKVGKAAKSGAKKATDAAKGATIDVGDAAKGGAKQATDAVKGNATKAADATKSAPPAGKKPPIESKLDGLLTTYEKKLSAHEAKLKGAKADARREMQTPIALDLAGFTKGWYSHASEIPKQMNLDQIKDYSNRFKILSDKYDTLLSKLIAGK